jgi:hypothetical protein
MEPARQKASFDEFLKKAVAEHSFTGGSLTLFVGSPPPLLPLKTQGLSGHVTSSDVQRFEQLLGTAAREGSFYALTPQQCEMALNEIIRNSALVPGVMLLQSVGVSKWLIDGQPVTTQSRFMLNFGMKPCLTTFLQFQTIFEFDFVRRVLSDLKLCELNLKHLKPIKQRLKKNSGEQVDA